MASSTDHRNPPQPPPAPPNPRAHPSSTTSPPLYTKSPNPSHSRPITQDPQPQLPYPRPGGFTHHPRPSYRPDQLLSLHTPGSGGYTRTVRPPFMYTPGDPHVHFMRPPPNPMLHPSQLGPRSAPVVAPPVKTAPAALPQKVGPIFPSPAPDFNCYRDPRDASRDDTVTVLDRKVRLSDGDSLYALCRSWVRNGLPRENQSQFSEGVKLLPKPSHEIVTDRYGSGDEDEDKEEDVGSVENLSASELLQMHVKRAKRVRARFRKERLRRIERYKDRLSLLLPSPDQYRNDINGS